METTTQFIYTPNKNITREEFLSISLSQISQAYEGKRDCCRCGCGGKYYATTFMKHPRSQVSDNYVQELLDKAKEKVLRGNADVMFYDSFIDVRVGRNKSITLYFDEIA